MLRFGIIGMGTRGNLFARSLSQSPYAKLVAVTDISDERAKQSANDYSAAGYTDYHEMIDKEALDCVVITTPDASHRGPLVYAADHKVNILCEKPFATTVEDADAMVEAVQRNGVMCMVAFENRWNLPCFSIKTRIEAGDIGDVLFYDAKLSTSIIVPTKFLPWSGSSTPAWYLFPHTLDLATWYSGQKVESVYATGTKKLLKSKGIDTYDTIHAIFKLTNGVTVQLLSSFVLPEKLPLRYDFKIDVIGEKGGLYMNTHDQMVHEIADSYSHVSVLVHPLHGMLVGPPTQMLYSFIEHVRKEIPIEANEIAGRANTAAVAAAHRSIIEGNPIKL